MMKTFLIFLYLHGFISRCPQCAKFKALQKGNNFVKKLVQMIINFRKLHFSYQFPDTTKMRKRDAQNESICSNEFESKFLCYIIQISPDHQNELNHPTLKLKERTTYCKMKQFTIHELNFQRLLKEACYSKTSFLKARFTTKMTTKPLHTP